VQSVTRAFELLEALAAAETSLALADLAQRAQLSAPTAHRLLKTMQLRGYIQQTADRNYSLGAALIRLGQKATPRLALQAQALLAELEQISEETANFAVLDGGLVAYIAQVPSRHHMRMFTEVGRKVLPHASGVGKAMLSVLPENQALQIVGKTGMPGYTPSTITTEDELLADLRESRRRGFAIDDGEQEIGVRCIAVALPGTNPPAAVSISGPAARVTDAKSSAYIEALQRVARQLASHA
jgi:IclR family acetate operon transcriptional repressor